VLHLHSTTNTFHFQGKEAISWFQEIFKTVAKQIHDECKLCVFSNQESSKTENSVNTNISGGSILLSILFTLCEYILIPLVVLKPYILKVSFSLLLGVIKDIRKIAFKQEMNGK
jgi:hypothetical protein